MRGFFLTSKRSRVVSLARIGLSVGYFDETQPIQEMVRSVGWICFFGTNVEALSMFEGLHMPDDCKMGVYIC